MADADEEYNTRYGGYRGYAMAYERVKLIPRHVLDVDLRAMVLAAGATDVEGAVDHLLRRFLRVPVTEPGRRALVDYLAAELDSTGLDEEAEGAPAKVEKALRSTLYLVFSSPEYQLG